MAQNDALGALPFNVAIPFAIEMIWSNIADVDLHLTGNNPANSTTARFHLNFANVGSYTSEPFAQLDEDQTGVGGSEVFGISALSPGAAYRAGVFNFGGGSAEVGGTALSNQANVRMRYITNGQISRGPGGSTIVNGTVRANVTAPTGQIGNAWIGLEINPSSGAATVINRFTNSNSSSDMATILDAP